MYPNDEHDRPGAAPAALEAHLVPIITRALQCGRGPAGLTDWLRRRTGGPGLLPRGADDQRRLVRRLAREVARRGFPAAPTYQAGQTVRPEELGV